MQTVAQTTHKVHKAFYAQLDGMSGYLTKPADALLFLAHGSTTAHVITPANVGDLDVLGEVGTAVAQFVADQLAGGFAAIACSRPMEVQ
jgi:hypothetical protein